MDWSGRSRRQGKRGSIDAKLPAIFARLHIDPGEWRLAMQTGGQTGPHEHLKISKDVPGQNLRWMSLKSIDGGAELPLARFDGCPRRDRQWMSHDLLLTAAPVASAILATLPRRSRSKYCVVAPPPLVSARTPIDSSTERRSEICAPQRALRAHTTCNPHARQRTPWTLKDRDRWVSYGERLRSRRALRRRSPALAPRPAKIANGYLSRGGRGLRSIWPSRAPQAIEKASSSLIQQWTGDPNLPQVRFDGGPRILFSRIPASLLMPIRVRSSTRAASRHVTIIRYPKCRLERTDRCLPQYF